MQTTEQYIAVVLFITLYKVVLTLESVDEILECDYSFKRKPLGSTSLWYCLLCCTRWF